MLSRADFAMLSAGFGERWPGTAASLLLHGVLLVSLGLTWRASPKPMSLTEWSAVEIVDEHQEMTMLPSVFPAPPASVSSLTRDQPSTEPPRAPTRLPQAPGGADGGKVRAERMFSQALLAGPYGAAMKRELGRMEGETRLVQLCNIEAMAQIDQMRTDRTHAQRVVAYARSMPQVRRSFIRAPGAAVDLGGRWMRLGYTCELAPDGKVAGFEFRLGAEITAKDWERFSLPPPGRTALD
ncbi:MAG TPA: DUF930 domain-containing protein [Rhabdaerophilum sp.]|nr:DUF930 domain-containing protein [Rhabdaerophilum sp.]